MKLKEIEELVNFITQLGLEEINIETADLKLSIKKNAPMPTMQQVVASRPASFPEMNFTMPPALVPSANSVASATVALESKPNENEVVIKSPMIGTFYRSAGPDKPSFVSVGDEVKAGQTVCIIEAMKLFNEIEAEVSGKITQILVEDASPVEYDQRLFIIEPS